MGVPQDLPRLPGVSLGEVRKTADGLTVLRFRAALSPREGVLFLVRALPAAGFTLGRGDAERNEADQPFQSGDLRGVFRALALDNCHSEWLLAVTTDIPGGGTGNPLLPSRTPQSSPSFFPFG